MRPYTTKVPYFDKLEHRNIKNLFRFLDKTFSKNRGNIVLNLKSYKRKEMCSGTSVILSAYMEKYKKQHSKEVYVTNVPSLKKAEGVKIQAEEALLKKLDIKTLSETNPVIVNKITKELKKIGVNNKNENTASKYERTKAILTELTANSIEHGIKTKDLHCRVSTEIDNKTKTITFTFIDFGVGIAHSQKKAVHKWWHRFRSDAYIVKNTILGKIPSSTKKPTRGQGLLDILYAAKEELIDNLIIVANSAVVYYINGEVYSKKISNFGGTYFTWTVTK